MKKDKIYWSYIAQLIKREYNILCENRSLHPYNKAFIAANEMANQGHSSDDVHEFLSNINPSYHSSAVEQWYVNGGNVPVENYIRKLVIHAFNIDKSKVQEPLFEGNKIHDNIIHKDAIRTINTLHNLSKKAHDELPDTIRIYRGIGLSHNIEGHEYVPHSVESWTTHLDTAKLFSTKSHISDSIPHVFSADINKNDILTSYNARKYVPIIPREEDLIGKEEYIPFGDRLKNITRII